MEEKKKILIVEDEETMLHALSEKFTQEGFEVTQASDGEEALKIVLSKDIDLVLLDIILPKMDGMTMLKKMRESDKDTPVILLTNLDYSVGVAKAIEAGAYDYLLKTDWSLEDVVKKVKDKFEKDK